MIIEEYSRIVDEKIYRTLQIKARITLNGVKHKGIIYISNNEKLLNKIGIEIKKEGQHVIQVIYSVNEAAEYLQSSGLDEYQITIIRMLRAITL